MADDHVVVLKVRPVKSSNGMEDKTELTISNAFDGVMQYQKSVLLRRGEARFKFVMNGGFFLVVHKPVSYYGSSYLANLDWWSGCRNHMGYVFSAYSEYKCA